MQKWQAMVGAAAIRKNYMKIPHLKNLAHIPAFGRFSQIDTNSDGYLSIEESTNFAMLHQRQAIGHTHSTADIVDGFEKADANGDGVIQPKEFDGDLKALLLMAKHSSNINITVKI